MAAAQVTQINLPSNEFELSLGTLGTLRGRVDVESIHEIERRTGESFMSLGMQAAQGSLRFGSVSVLCEVMLKRVLVNATPTRSEIESAIVEAGIGNVVRALHRPFVYVMNGDESDG